MSQKKNRQNGGTKRKKMLMVASVASMIDQFNKPNISLLQDLGYEVYVLCNFRKGNTCDDACIKKFKHELKMQSVVWQQWACPRDIRDIPGCIRAFLQLWQLTGEHAFEFIHCHSPVGGVISRIVAKIRKIPVIYTAHGFHFYKGAPLKNWLLYYPVEKLLAYWTNVLITVNKEDYAFAKSNLAAGKVFRIPGVGIDTGRFARVRAETLECEGSGITKFGHRIFREHYDIPQDALLLLSVGELNEGKNHWMVLEAIGKLPGKNIYYVICGQGKLRERLLQYAQELGIAERVRMPGYVEDIAAAYMAADIFVFPSKREGMPVALMEAMAAGLPCVVSDIRGNRELILECRPWDSSGVWRGTENFLSDAQKFSFVHSGDLAAKLRAMVLDEQLRDSCGRFNQRRIAGYDLQIVLKKMCHIYQYMGKKCYEKKDTTCAQNESVFRC